MQLDCMQAVAVAVQGLAPIRTVAAGQPLAPTQTVPAGQLLAADRKRAAVEPLAAERKRNQGQAGAADRKRALVERLAAERKRSQEQAVAADRDLDFAAVGRDRTVKDVAAGGGLMFDQGRAVEKRVSQVLEWEMGISAAVVFAVWQQNYFLL